MASGVAGLRAWARGNYSQEAGIELLARVFSGRFADAGCPWVKSCSRPGVLWLDVAALLDYSGVCSGGERRVLIVVAALVDDRPIDDVGDVLAGLDRRTLVLVLAAFAHAAGSHEHADLIRTGDQLVCVPLPALVPWPDRRAA